MHLSGRRTAGYETQASNSVSEWSFTHLRGATESLLLTEVMLPVGLPCFRWQRMCVSTTKIFNRDLLVVLGRTIPPRDSRHSHKHLAVSSLRVDEATIVVRRVQGAAGENKENM